MFAQLFRTVSVFEQYDIRIKAYVPTMLGRQFGFTPRWTISRFSERWGMWTVNDRTMHKGEELEVNEPLTVASALTRMTYKVEWRGWLVETLDLFEYGVYGVKTIIKPNGETVIIPPQDDKCDTLTVPALTD